MDTTTLIILAIIALIAVYLFNRNRVQPRGTYNDEDYRSSGSIGDGPAYDDEDFRSGGSIGGSSQRDYDSPDFESGGSIGGQRRTVTTPKPASTSRGSERPRHDNPDFESGGSIGGSSSSRGSSVSSNRPSSNPKPSGNRPALRGKDAKDK